MPYLIRVLTNREQVVTDFIHTLVVLNVLFFVFSPLCILMSDENIHFDWSADIYVRKSPVQYNNIRVIICPWYS